MDLNLTDEERERLLKIGHPTSSAGNSSFDIFQVKVHAEKPSDHIAVAYGAILSPWFKKHGLNFTTLTNSAIINTTFEPDKVGNKGNYYVNFDLLKVNPELEESKIATTHHIHNGWDEAANPEYRGKGRE